MFIAHACAGYLWTRHFIRSNENRELSSKLVPYVGFGIFCSILPDLDLLYFYTLDNRQNPHHSYWTHMPFFWLTVSALVYGIGTRLLRKIPAAVSIILGVNTCLHLVLDSVAGGIYWFYPLSDAYVVWVPITARFDWWVWNFIFHWVFLMELLIVSLAVWVYQRDRQWVSPANRV
ncbi:MAG: metal-dependent hydrolase [Gammaproteobacteria bacterium]|nr:metal-dependent hydrolase [Gammaproteobacteria bacterium]MDH5800133.1 metal-dependent hydrolase [Gammaproteobacteria bacterium]